MPREELEENRQPHRSFYGKMACYMDGVNPYPPRKLNEESEDEEGAAQRRYEEEKTDGARAFLADLTNF